MKNKKPRHNLKMYLHYRKELRNNSTRAEYILWFYLKDKKLNNVKFRRQHSIDHYILDFYCPSKKLAIEVDGGYHLLEDQKQYDKVRDSYLKRYGIQVIRFENELIYHHIDDVLKEISYHLENKIS